MKKKEIAGLIKFKGKRESATHGLRVITKRIITVGFFLIFIVPLNKQVLADKEIKPGKKQATLILSDGRKILLGTSKDTIINIEASNVRIKIDSTGVNYIFDNKRTTNVSKTKSVKKSH